MLYPHHFAIQVINVVAIVAGEENLLGEPSYKYLTADEMRGLGDDSMAIDVTHDEKPIIGSPFTAKIKPASDKKAGIDVSGIQVYGPGVSPQGKDSCLLRTSCIDGLS